MLPGITQKKEPVFATAAALVDVLVYMIGRNYEWRVEAEKMSHEGRAEIRYTPLNYPASFLGPDKITRGE